MSKPDIYVSSSHSRPDRGRRQRLVADFCNSGVVVSDDGGSVVEILNYCIERRLLFTLSWLGKTATIRNGRESG